MCICVVESFSHGVFLCWWPSTCLTALALIDRTQKSSPYQYQSEQILYFVASSVVVAFIFQIVNLFSQKNVKSLACTARLMTGQWEKLSLKECVEWQKEVFDCVSKNYLVALQVCYLMLFICTHSAD